jgi:hypothetical protein
MAWELGKVGHFRVAVGDPERSARWWVEIGLDRQFDFDGGVAVGNAAITIALQRGRPDQTVLGHLSFALGSPDALREALADLRGVELEDPGDEIGPEFPGSPNMGRCFHDLDGYRWELDVRGRP